MEWQESDLQNLISNQVEENINLDYKAAAGLAKTDAKKADISKDVSSFANSEGGVLVYGMVESGRLPTNIDPIDPGAISREWLEQVINSNIQRRIDGIRINSVALSEINAGKVVYVVEVPQSTMAPHQANDKKYYKRFNFQSVPMEDYEMRDVANRRRNPIVKAKLTLGRFNPRGPEYTSATASLILKNEGQVLAEMIYLELAIPAGAVDGAVRRFPSKDMARVSIDRQDYMVHKYVHNNENGLLPLFPGAETEVFDGNIRYLSVGFSKAWFRTNYAVPIRCKVFADHAEPQEWSIPIVEFVPPEVRIQFPILA